MTCIKTIMEKSVSPNFTMFLRGMLLCNKIKFCKHFNQTKKFTITFSYIFSVVP